jgi:2-oxoglutarate dehydrogenase E1 component
MEGSKNTPKFSTDEKKVILNKLNQAVVFENFLHTKFVGQKRFSLEGAEATIPALDAVCEKGADMGIEDFVIGMAHRGRLNVLANILNKTYKDIFTEFEGRPSEDSLFDGDVKYHMGYSSDQKSNTGKPVHLSLTPNPSHLEAVDPVVQGIARAKIDNLHKGDNSKVCPILIHGDAALAGQGIVYEVLQMSQLDGYKTGGTVHIVINNQVGFTTNYLDARSSTYCTDVAKVVLSPVFHVNGDDVEALVFTSRLAMEFRQKFKCDVFIDVLCYRKYGHNEGDEPRFTQPLLYKAIAKHPNPREIYMQQLTAEGSVSADLAKEMEKKFKDLLQEKLDEAKQTEKAKITSFLEGQWKGVENG